jgi:transposase
MDAIVYVDCTGIPWRYLPQVTSRTGNTVYGYFATWQTDIVLEELSGLLRRLVREREGRNSEPSGCVLNSQIIKTGANVPLSDQGTDAGKRIIGRRRQMGCDTLGCRPFWSPRPASPRCPVSPPPTPASARRG